MLSMTAYLVSFMIHPPPWSPFLAVGLPQIRSTIQMKGNPKSKPATQIKERNQQQRGLEKENAELEKHRWRMRCSSILMMDSVIP
jgi:hypothetical protein